MAEELEQSNENQEQLEQSNGNQDQLIEIYKLQSQLADSISNRRFTINRFYILIMAGLFLVFPAFFKFPDEIRNLLPIGYLVAGVAFLGITLSVAWFISINSNLRLGMIKYEALKNLESELDYQFFNDEWNFLERYGKHRTYWEVSYIEIFMPILFFFIFSISLNVISVSSPGKFYFIFTTFPAFLAGLFSTVALYSWQIDQEIRGLERWTNKKIRLVSFFIMLMYLSVVVFLPNVIGDNLVNIRGVESANEKPAEPDSEKSTKEQIIRPDGKEQKESESVDEPPTGATSEEAVKEQPISPDGKARNESQ